MKKMILFLVLIPFCVMGKPFYLVNGDQVFYLGKVFAWNNTFYADLSQISVSLDLQWSYKNGVGVVVHKNDFISFNTYNHLGVYDALYDIGRVASGVKTPYLSVNALSKLVNLEWKNEPVGILMIKKKPAVTLNGALLYGKGFTLFFNSKPASQVVKVKSHGMVATVTVFPILISKKYKSVNSPLVVEKDGKISATYRVTHDGILNISTAVGFPSLPIQKSKALMLEKGVEYHSFESTSVSGKVIHLGVVKVSPGSAKIKVVYPKNGMGNLQPITSMIAATSLTAIGLPAVSRGFVMYGGKILSAPVYGEPTMVWNDQKFDIIETSPMITVNIGDVPFMINGINCATGDVVIYTKDYGLPIPKSDQRIYFEVQENKIIGNEYKPRAKNEMILSLTNNYDLFLKNVQLGDKISFFTSFGESGLKGLVGAIQGSALLVYNSQRVRTWASQDDVCGGKSTLVVGIKDDDLYFLKISSKEGIKTDDLSNLLLNLGFSKAMCFKSKMEVSMIVQKKVVDFYEHGLYPVGFGIEIDKTTGGA